MKTKIFATEFDNEGAVDLYLDLIFCHNRSSIVGHHGDCLAMEASLDDDNNVSARVYRAKKEDLKGDITWMEKTKWLNVQKAFIPFYSFEGEKAISVFNGEGMKDYFLNRYKALYFDFKVNDNFLDETHPFIEVDLFNETMVAMTKDQVLQKYPSYKKTIKLPAGEYYIGDPCYIYENSHPRNGELWGEVCNAMDFDDRYCVVDTVVDGVRMVYSSTAHGDGTYRDNNGLCYGVDAGIIGIVSGEIASRDYYCRPESLGHFHQFDKDFEVVIALNSFQFGDIIIDTN